MKKLTVLFFCVLVTLVYAKTKNHQATISNAVNQVAGNTTNATQGVVLDVWARSDGNAAILNHVSIFARCSGTAAATNIDGTATATFYFSRSWDGVNFDSATNSDLKIVVPLNGTETNQVSIRRELNGAQYLRHTRTENISFGAATNFFFGVSGNYEE